MIDLFSAKQDFIREQVALLSAPLKIPSRFVREREFDVSEIAAVLAKADAEVAHYLRVANSRQATLRVVRRIEALYRKQEQQDAATATAETAVATTISAIGDATLERLPESWEGEAEAADMERYGALVARLRSAAAERDRVRLELHARQQHYQDLQALGLQEELQTQMDNRSMEEEIIRFEHNMAALASKIQDNEELRDAMHRAALQINTGNVQALPLSSVLRELKSAGSLLTS